MPDPSRASRLLGVLFAWPFLPKLARAEGRDPRFLTIVLRGALDGLAAVAPVGDPDWVKLRGDRALTLDGNTPALPLDSLLRAQPGDAESVSALSGTARRRSCMRRQRPIASARISTARTCWKAACPSPAGPTAAGSIARSAASKPRRRVDPKGRRAFAVGPVTPLVVRGTGPGHVVDAAAHPAGERRHLMRLLDLYHHTDPSSPGRSRAAAGSPTWRGPAA